jgi:hypothetical protein
MRILSDTLLRKQGELDEDCKRILLLAMKSPKTPPQISKLTDIPITRCWEKVRYLESLGLIRPVLAFVNNKGKAVRYYETSIHAERLEERGLENLVTSPYMF